MLARRTVERFIADGSLIRADGPDSRTYVTAVSVAATESRRTASLRRGNASEELALVLSSMDKLLAALGEDRAALLQAVRERDEARSELAALRATRAAQVV